MRRIEIAEAILSLAADREHATAIAGDLLEESRGSARWFWWQVAQTSILRTGRQLSAAPFGMLGAAMLALLFELGMITLISIPAGIAGAVTGVHSSFHPERALNALFVITGTFIIPFVIGRWIGRRYPGREGSVIASWVCVHVFLNVGMSVLNWKLFHPDAPSILVYFAGFALFETIPTLIMAAGAAFARYKIVRGTAHA